MKPLIYCSRLLLHTQPSHSPTSALKHLRCILVDNYSSNITYFCLCVGVGVKKHACKVRSRFTASLPFLK